jgi:thymidylate synthase (FAD)
MKVTLIDYTGAGSPNPSRRAANLLVFTKSTRLQMDPGRMKTIEEMSWKEIITELAYMAKTIPSSWEFVNYTFLIEGVSRAFTHQFVRTRTGSYAQQTMRILNVSGFDYVTGPSIGEPSIEDRPDEPANIYREAMAGIQTAYDKLISAGVAIEDARGILPTNICTNIVASFNLRVVCELSRKRASSRTQGEYRDVLEAMKAEVIEVHPFADIFLTRDFDMAAAELETMVRKCVNPTDATNMIKMIDQMRQS